MNQPLIDASSKGEEELTINVDHNSSGLTSQRAAQLLEQYGYNELQEEITNPIIEFLKNFWGPMPIMIWLAIIIEVIPITARILKILDPIIFPIEMSNSFLYIATNVVANSGRLVPMATIVNPITLSDTPK